MNESTFDNFFSPETWKRLLNPIFPIYLFDDGFSKGFESQETPRTDFCADICIGLEISKKQLSDTQWLSGITQKDKKIYKIWVCTIILIKH